MYTVIWVWLYYANTKTNYGVVHPPFTSILPKDLLSIAAFRDTHTYFSMDTGSGVPCRRTVMTLEMVLMVAGVNWLSFRMWSSRPTIPRSRISWKLLLWSLQRRFTFSKQCFQIIKQNISNKILIPYIHNC